MQTVVNWPVRRAKSVSAGGLGGERLQLKQPFCTGVGKLVEDLPAPAVERSEFKSKTLRRGLAAAESRIYRENVGIVVAQSRRAALDPRPGKAGETFIHLFKTSFY
jgi:hypothetical protein